MHTIKTPLAMNISDVENPVNGSFQQVFSMADKPELHVIAWLS